MKANLDCRLKIDAQMQLLFDVFMDALVLLEKCDGKAKIIMKNRVYDTLFQISSARDDFDEKREAINGAHALFLGEMAAQLERDGSTKTKEYRFRYSEEDAEIILEVCGRLAEEHGDGTLFLFSMKDVTACRAREGAYQKKLKGMRLNEECFGIAMKQVNLNIWEYDLVKNQYIKACRTADRYPLPDIVEDYPRYMLKLGLVHTDSMEDYRRLHERVKNGEAYASSDVFVMEKDRQFHWHRIKYTTIFDEDGNPVRAVGSSENLDDLVMAEKRYQEEACFKQSIIDTTLFYYEVDLTSRKILATDSQIFNSWFIPKKIALKQILYYIHDTYINPGDRKKFRELMDFDKIILKYRRGEIQDLQFELRACWGKMKTYRWISLTARIREGLENDHVIAFFYVRDINDKKLKLLEVEKKAEQDELTGIYNRYAFKEKMKKALTALEKIGGSGAFFILDIDAFKEINDTWGHTIGDDVLKKIAQVLKSLFEIERDIIGRLGGDELVVFMPRQNLADIVEKGQQICRGVQKIQIRGMKTQLSCSGGIALFPEHGTEIDSLYERADQALYYAKRNGKNRCSVYSEKM